MRARQERQAPILPIQQVAESEQELLTEILIGLKQIPKRLPPKFFYDQQGSRLFEKITELPEYYLTRTENAILQRYRHVIAAYVGESCILLEPGSGSCRKVEILLDALRPQLYVPIDIAAEQLHEAIARLARDYPWLHCQGVTADFSAVLELQLALPHAKRVVFYPGSSIGNFDPPAAVDFLRQIATLVGPGGGLLIGVDLQKEPALLHSAYNDRQGVTAAFNRNMLRHLNRLVGTNFSVEAFDHVAFYNPDQRRIEMYLQARFTHDVMLGGQPIHFRAGERIHTENSYKYTTESFTAVAAKAGFRREHSWYDERELFSVHYLVADASAVFADSVDFEYIAKKEEELEQDKRECPR